MFFVLTNLNELIPVSFMLINSLEHIEYIKVQVVLTFLRIASCCVYTNERIQNITVNTTTTT
jgi:hypothetical protein